jgi:hypothetical protein
VQQVRWFPQLEEEAMAEATLAGADSPRRPRELSVSFAPLPAPPASAGSSPEASTARVAAAPSFTTSRVKPAPASICSAVAADVDEAAAAAAFAALPPWCRAVVFDAQAVPGVSPRPSSRQTPGESHTRLPIPMPFTGALFRTPLGTP